MLSVAERGKLIRAHYPRDRVLTNADCERIGLSPPFATKPMVRSRPLSARVPRSVRPKSAKAGVSGSGSALVDSELQEASALHKTNTKLEAGVERMTAGPFLRQLRLEVAEQYSFEAAHSSSNTVGEHLSPLAPSGASASVAAVKNGAEQLDQYSNDQIKRSNDGWVPHVVWTATKEQLRAHTMIALEPALARLRHHVNDKSKLRAREHELVEVASRKLGTRKYAFTKKGYRLHLRSGDRIRLLEFADRWVDSLIDRKARLEAALGASAPAQGTAQDASKGSGVETQGAAVRLPSLLDESEAGSTSIAVNVPASVVESGQTFASRLETPSEECVVPSVEPAAEFGEELASPSPTEAPTPVEGALCAIRDALETMFFERDGKFKLVITEAARASSLLNTLAKSRVGYSTFYRVRLPKLLREIADLPAASATAVPGMPSCAQQARRILLIYHGAPGRSGADGADFLRPHAPAVGAGQAAAENCTTSRAAPPTVPTTATQDLDSRPASDYDADQPIYPLPLPGALSAAEESAFTLPLPLAFADDDEEDVDMGFGQNSLESDSFWLPTPPDFSSTAEVDDPATAAAPTLASPTEAIPERRKGKARAVSPAPLPTTDSSTDRNSSAATTSRLSDSSSPLEASSSPSSFSSLGESSPLALSTSLRSASPISPDPATSPSSTDTAPPSTPEPASTVDSSPSTSASPIASSSRASNRSSPRRGDGRSINYRVAMSDDDDDSDGSDADSSEDEYRHDGPEESEDQRDAGIVTDVEMEDVDMLDDASGREQEFGSEKVEDLESDDDDDLLDEVDVRMAESSEAEDDDSEGLKSAGIGKQRGNKIAQARGPQRATNRSRATTTTATSHSPTAPAPAGGSTSATGSHSGVVAVPKKRRPVRKWTTTEDKKLLALADGTTTLTKAAAELDRSVSVAHARYKRLTDKTWPSPKAGGDRRNWTKKEEKRMFELAEQQVALKVAADELKRSFTSLSVHYQAKTNKSWPTAKVTPFFTAAEDAAVTKGLEAGESAVTIGAKIGRAAKAVRNRRDIIKPGPKRTKRSKHVWSVEDDQYLREAADLETPINDIAKALNVTRSMVCHRKEKLGLGKDRARVSWDKDQDAALRDAFERKLTYPAIAKELGTTASAVSHRIGRLNLRRKV
ncbi:hypothetical protein RHOSPDRAFT_34523 [Rhodotorula sp. JG-1b]|nr:hypothetical protein RHOSPDRAFT_34523 [Rhodotorula sp. JG-1b]